MKLSKELIDEVKLFLPAAKQAYDSQVQQETAQQDTFAQPVIKRIPSLIAKAIAAKRYYAEVAVIHTFQYASVNKLFMDDPRSEKLFFEWREDWKWVWQEDAPKPEWLLGAAKLVYAYCVDNDLRPKLMPYHRHTERDAKKSYWWQASNLIIRWQPEHINKLLGITE